MTRVLALSPHLDDAVFSAGATLAQHAMDGAEVTVATVFTATVPHPQGFALACQLDKGLGSDVDYMALRRAEDEHACAALGARAVHLPFAEAPHRGYASAPDLFGPRRGDDDVVVRIALALRRLLDEIDPNLLFAPQGVGAHVDHGAVVDAVLQLAPRCTVRWWRDHPYSVRTAQPLEPYGDLWRGPPICSSPTSAAFRRKHDAAMSYASQLGFQFGGDDAASQAFLSNVAVEDFAER